MPTTGKARAFREDDPIDLSAVPEADRTKENRGAVGIKHDRSGARNSSSLTANEASGTIGGDTPPPIFDRAAIAAGQKNALAGERRGPRTSPTGRVPLAGTPGGPGAGSGPASTNLHGNLAASGTGPSVAVRESPRPGALTGQPGLRHAPSPAPPASPSAPISAVIVDDSLADDSLVDDSLQTALDESSPLIPPPTPARPRLAVPVGEFDHGHGPTVVDSASQMRDDATVADSAAGRIERGDPTAGGRADATSASSPGTGHASAGTLRSSAALLRQRGILGDIRYIATVVLGVRKAKRELFALEAKQATRQQSRRRHLVTLGRTAVAYPDSLDDDPQHRREPHPALGPARAQLAKIEAERADHAGQVTTADAELTRVRRDREAKAKQYGVDLAALDSELLAIARKLEPLEKEVSGVKKRAADLRDALRRIDGKIAATEASLASAKAEKLDRAEVQAELATLRADRKAIQRDEPAIAGQLDTLTPRVAALEAARGEAQRKRAELETAEQEDQRRVEEMLVAIGARRKVVDRAAADAEALRDKILFQLGEQLYVDRPDHLIGQLAPLDEIDVELGEADRRVMELREILSSIDRGKLARGIALIVLILGAIGALTGWLLHLFP